MKRMSVGHEIMSPYIEVVMKCGNKIIVMRIYQRTKDLRYAQNRTLFHRKCIMSLG